jgi:hypothetical protein
LQRLLERSIDMGKQMLGNAWDWDAIKAKFESHTAKKKFCSLNVPAVLEDPSAWQAFLMSDSRSNHTKKVHICTALHSK